MKIENCLYINVSWMTFVAWVIPQWDCLREKKFWLRFRLNSTEIYAPMNPAFSISDCTADIPIHNKQHRVIQFLLSGWGSLSSSNLIIIVCERQSLSPMVMFNSSNLLGNGIYRRFASLSKYLISNAIFCRIFNKFSDNKQQYLDIWNHHGEQNTINFPIRACNLKCFNIIFLSSR